MQYSLLICLLNSIPWHRYHCLFYILPLEGHQWYFGLLKIYIIYVSAYDGVSGCHMYVW